MAYRFKSPTYSFVSFNDQRLDEGWAEDTSPAHNLGFCLPFQKPDDVAFQFILEGDTEAQGDNICDTSYNYMELAIYMGDPVPAISNSQFANAPLMITLDMVDTEKYRLNDTQVLYYVSRLPDTIESYLQDGQCFQIALRVYVGGVTLIRAVSNCFRYAPYDNYTSAIAYKGNEDEAFFRYCPSVSIVNKVRLPVYTSKALYTEEQNVYRQSDGTLTIIKAEIGKSYEVQADYMPEWAHDCMQALLVHDVKTIVSAKYTGGFQKSGSYELDHPKFLDYPLIPAKFKIDASPLLIKNNISGVCEVLPNQISSPPEFIHTFDACLTYSISFEDMGISACCGPLAGWFESIHTTGADPTDSINVVGNTLIIDYKGPNPGIGVNNEKVLGLLHLSCPNGNQEVIGISCKWNGNFTC